MIRFWNVANAITLAGLLAGLASALLATHGRLPLAVVALVVSGVCDLLDGLVARRLALPDEARRFGAHLDSAVDACSFGLAPTLLLHRAGLTTPPELALLGLFSCCAVWRLAYFDTVGLGGSGVERYYTGLPTTFVALVLPFALLAGFHSAEALRIAAAIATPVLALLMVSPLRIPKPRGAAYVVLVLLAGGMIGVYGGLGERFCR